MFKGKSARSGAASLQDTQNHASDMSLLLPSNLRLSQITKQNAATLERAALWREDFESGKASVSDIPKLKQDFRFFGIFPCEAAGIEFVMFHANDDIVVWDYLWRGADGYEPEMVSTWVSWCRQPGVVLDIGGYSGLMSILAARAHPENQVHLFEPLDRVIERANINVKLNGFGRRIALHPMAASNEIGEARINMYRGENALGTGSSLVEKRGKEATQTKIIQTTSIDQHLPGIEPVAVKVDVEGHELAVLKGMRETLTRSRPNMLIEVWDPTRSEVLSMLTELGYNFSRVEPVDRPVNNYIATPRSA